MSSRPPALFPLFAGLETLQGVGPKTEEHLAQLAITKPRDLLFTLPYAVIDRRRIESIKDADLPRTLTVAVTVGPHTPPRNKGGAYRIHVEDAQTSFQIVYFHANAKYLQQQLPTGSRRLVSGKVELFDGIANMVHPDHVLPEAEPDGIPSFEPVYPLTSGVTQKTMFKATRGALSRLPDVAEWIDPNLIAQNGWPAWALAVQTAHNPAHMDDLSPHADARARLAYDELMAHQLTMGLARAKVRRAKGRESHGTGALQSKVLDGLPYAPTGAQTRAIAEITADMANARV